METLLLDRAFGEEERVPPTPPRELAAPTPSTGRPHHALAPRGGDDGNDKGPPCSPPALDPVSAFMFPCAVTAVVVVVVTVGWFPQGE